MNSFYFTMYTAIPAKGESVGEGTEYLEKVVEVPEGMVITAIEFGVINDVPLAGKKRFPVMRAPMNMHEDNKRIHTICTRKDDEIEAVECDGIEIVEW